MALRPSLSTKQTTQLALTPSMRQGLSLLQMPAVSMIAELRREADENPLIELIEPTGYTGDLQADQHAHPVSLSQSLSQQISLLPLPRDVSAVAQFITGDLTPEGYLSSTDAELSEALAIDVALIRRAIAAIQSCDPPGVGARSLSECLALQLIDRGITASTAQTLCSQLPLVAEGRYAKVARLTGLPQEEIESLAALLPHLNPHPGNEISAPTKATIAEFIVELDVDGNLSVSPNTGAVPEPRLDTHLLSQIGTQSDLAQTFEPRAKALLRAYAFRSKTIAQVITALVAQQHRFFLNGPNHMAPLTRTEIAATLSLHPSTVGRAISGKYMSYRGATYPLESFLTRGLNTDHGEAVSAYVIQHRIQTLIGNEDSAAPLSDAQIADILAEQGVDIARRTVAKYRGCMNIPSSFKRARNTAARLNRPALPGSGPSNTT